MLIDLFVILSIRPNTFPERAYHSFTGTKASWIANAHGRLSVKGLKYKSRGFDYSVGETDWTIESMMV